MNFSEGDIVLILYYPVSGVAGRTAEVRRVRPNFCGTETWYALNDVTGRPRAAAHSWLQRQGWAELCGALKFDTAEA